LPILAEFARLYLEPKWHRFAIAPRPCRSPTVWPYQSKTGSANQSLKEKFPLHSSQDTGTTVDGSH
jgi:hypothetical protein